LVKRVYTSFVAFDDRPPLTIPKNIDSLSIDHAKLISSIKLSKLTQLKLIVLDSVLYPLKFNSVISCFKFCPKLIFLSISADEFSHVSEEALINVLNEDKKRPLQHFQLSCYENGLNLSFETVKTLLKCCPKLNTIEGLHTWKTKWENACFSSDFFAEKGFILLKEKGEEDEDLISDGGGYQVVSKVLEKMLQACRKFLE